MGRRLPENRKAEAKRRGGKRSTSWKPGQSGNPGGRPKGYRELRELARQFTAEAIDTLVELMRDRENANVALAASKSLLDRAWGTAESSSQAEEDFIKLVVAAKLNLSPAAAEEFKALLANFGTLADEAEARAEMLAQKPVQPQPQPEEQKA